MENNLPPHCSEILNLGSEAISDAVSVDAELIMDFSSTPTVEDAATPATTAPANPEIHLDLVEISKMVPDKMAFKIGEVADLAGIKPYVLRYWESEFDALNPQKSAFNQRMYSKKDVETVLLIKKLLYEEKFSIAGAKRKIREVRKELKAEKQLAVVHDKLDDVGDRLLDLLPEIQALKTLFS